MAFKKTFLLSDESINSYGWWILLSGVDLTAIQKNCPLYYEHRTWEIPCGHVENIRLQKDQLFGDIVIEGGNDIEREYIRKIENGDIKGCSLGIDPTEWSEEPALLKQGQTRATLSKCLPFEVSLAPLPANRNSLALRNGNDMVTLSVGTNYDFIPDLKTQTNMKKIALQLGMPETATEDQICEALKPLQLKAGTVDGLQKVIEDTVASELPEAQKAFFVSLSKTNMPAALEFLALNKRVPGETLTTELPPVGGVQVKATKVVDLIQLGKEKTVSAADGKDSFDYLQKHNSVELGRIKSTEPEKYTKLVADYAAGVRYK